MLSKNLQEILCRTINFAVNQLNHFYLLPEHLLFCLLDEENIVAFLSSLSVNIQELKNDVYSFLVYDLEDLKKRDFFAEIRPSNTLKFTQSFISILERAITHASYSQKKSLESQDILLEILLDFESHSDYLLTKQNIEPSQLIKFFKETTRDSVEEKTAEKQKIITPNFLNERGYDFLANFSAPLKDKKSVSILDQYCINLNEKSKKNKIDNLIGREKEIGLLMRALCCRKKNSVILVGESGVGKTAIVEHLSKKIAKKDLDIPEQLRNDTIYSLDISALMSGTRYRGDLEERLRLLIAEIEASKSSIKLFIDEIHNIVGTGSTNQGTLDIGNILKPHLARGTICCIGATTIKEFHQYLSKDKALVRRFQKIDVQEPSNQDSQKMIEGIINLYSKHHNVSYMKNAISEAIFLSKRYFTEKHLPDAAIDVLDFAGASQNMIAEPGNKRISKKEIQDAVSSLTEIPIGQLTASQLKVTTELETNLRKHIFGQEDAIKRVCNAVAIHKCGLNERDNSKPIASFLFYGPTGVGKTELAHQIASSLGMKLLRFDMSEYSELHTMSKLTGAPPGYVGFEQSGLLSDQVLKHPYSVIIFDEIEKAHHNIHNAFLQIMDYGTMTDSFGRKIKFSDTIVIFTTNAAARSMDKLKPGFNGTTDSAIGDREINDTFSPEFRNRLTAILRFNHLSSSIISQILETELVKLAGILRKKNIELCVKKSARDFLIKHGYDVKMGARNIRRMLDKAVKPQIAELLMAKQVAGNLIRNIVVETSNNKLTTTFEDMP